MSKLLLIIIEFFKTGLFAVGGGLATIPFLTEIAEKYAWFTIEDLSTMIAVSESTPGPIGVNMATYVGFTTYGPVGALLATLSLVAPSVIIISIIANYLQKFKEAQIVKKVFAGLKPAVVAFIVAAVWSLFTKTLLHLDVVSGSILEYFNFKTICILVGLLFLNQKYPKLHPIFFIVIAAVCGIVFQL